MVVEFKTINYKKLVGPFKYISYAIHCKYELGIVEYFHSRVVRQGWSSPKIKLVVFAALP